VKKALRILALLMIVVGLIWVLHRPEIYAVHYHLDAFGIAVIV